MQDHCWQKIGIQGDRSCPELEKYTHCRDCHVYRRAGQGLLDRPAPEGYIEEWTELVARKDAGDRSVSAGFSVAIFRLGDEWLGLPAGLFQLVVAPLPVHQIPHRSDRLLQGLVNVQGKLLLCVAMAELLKIERLDEQPKIEHVGKSPRLIVMMQKADTWAFQVDEFSGIQRFHLEDQSNVPSLSSQALSSFTQNILRWQEKQISYLDPERLFESLRRQIL